MSILRLYLDTSVIGGCLDEGFSGGSRRLIVQAVDGHIRLVLSDVVLDELLGAPLAVQKWLELVPWHKIEMIYQNEEVTKLRDAYLDAGILTPKSINDATHVAYATYSKVDAIVSWNFKHIVQLGKMKAYNEVNKAYGYPHLDIISPRELET